MSHACNVLYLDCFDLTLYRMLQSWTKPNTAAKHLHSSAESTTGDSLTVQYVVCADQRQLTGLFSWQSTLVQDNRPGWRRPVRGVVTPR